MTETIFKIIEAALSIWSSKEKTKYLDQVLKLKRKWYDEFTKDDNIRDYNVLCSIELELRILGDTLASAIGASGVQDK